jgi:glycosyltransferase involved in cell wall biosynthesis
LPELGNRRDIRIFVLLGHDFGANSWERRQALGLIPGLNDRLAYGYYRAAGQGWVIEYSHDSQEGSLARFARLAVRKVLGFDLLHVYRNRALLLRADIIWTHTELENLAALAFFRILRCQNPPKVIANCIWLFDRWPSLSRSRRFLYRTLLKDATVITTFSPKNLEVAKQLLPSVRCECLLWGALTQEMALPRRGHVHRPVRIASLGNDVHRDWITILRAFGNVDGYEVRIGSSKISSRQVRGLRNVTVKSVELEDQVRALYDWADIVVISLKPNLHVSGLTVIFESIICGVPTICTDTGGLRVYFSDVEVTYVPVFAPVAMRVAAERLSVDNEGRFTQTIRAQQRLISGELTARGFAMRNRSLSEELLREGSASYNDSAKGFVYPSGDEPNVSGSTTEFCSSDGQPHGELRPGGEGRTGDPRE